jgi:putative ABC transport system permease protein
MHASWRSLRSLFRRRRWEEDLHSELQFHLDMQAEEYRRRGLSPEAADHAARRDLGGLAQVEESCRDAAGFVWLQDLWRDLQYGGRTLLRNPGFTLAAVVTLALGIGANTAVFSVVNSVVLEPLPFHEPERLVMLWQDNPERWNDIDQVASADFVDWQRENTVFEAMGFVGSQQSASRNFLLRRGDLPVRLRGRFADSGLFEVLGVPPQIGRAFRPEEDAPGQDRVAILSHGLWQRLFANDPNAIGQTIDVGEPYEIVGVMPPGFAFPQDAELWLSWSGYPFHSSEGTRWRHSLWVVARLKPGVTAEQAQSELTELQQRIAAENPGVQKIATQVKVVPLLDQVIGGGTRPALLALLAAVGFVLLIACANVANLLLARATGRQKELAVRVSLGAGRWRVVRQMLTESVLLSLIGGGLGVLLAVWGINLLEAVRPDDAFRSVKEVRFDRVQDIRLDARVLGFTLLLSVLTGIVFGLVPALQASRVNLNDVLKEEGRTTTAARSSRRFGNALLVAEIALSLILLVGAVQMLQSFAGLQAIDTGVRAEHVVQAEVDLGMAAQRYSGSAQDVYFQIRERLEALPDVISVSGAGESPLAASGWQDTIAIQGLPATPASELRTSDVRVVAPGSFEALGVPILEGRDLTERDTEQATIVVVVNAEFARQFCGGRSPIGESFQFRGVGRRYEIVGLVGNVRSYNRDRDVRPEIYVPYRQSFFTGGELGPLLVVRTRQDPAAAIAALRLAVEGDNPPGPILKDFTMAEQLLAASASSERFQTILLGVFAALALVLAAIGVYGVISYSTAQRVHEIGIRTALGAQPGHVLRLILGHGLLLALAGAGVGVAGAFGLARLSSSLLYGITAADPLVVGGVAVVLTAVALAACLIPARRAMNVDPMVALRHE